VIDEVQAQGKPNSENQLFQVRAELKFCPMIQFELVSDYSQGHLGLG